MKSFMTLVLFLLSFQTMAKNIEKKKVSKGAQTQVQLGTSFRFDGTSLQGKYQNSSALNATVENDKYLEDILSPRKNFDDRVRQDQERY